MSAHHRSGCPLCGREVGPEPRQLEVCRPCADGMDRLHRAVSRTGEYSALSESEVAAAGAAPPATAAGKVCSGCGKNAAEVAKLLAAPGLIICSECVRLCVDILDSELGPAWRS